MLLLPLCIAYFIALCWRFPLCFCVWFKIQRGKSCTAAVHISSSPPLPPLLSNLPWQPSLFVRAHFCTTVNSVCAWPREFMQRKRKVQTKVQLQNARLPFVLAQARVGAGAGSGTEAEAEAAVSMATLTGPLTPSWPNLLLPSSVPSVALGRLRGLLGCGTVERAIWRRLPAGGRCGVALKKLCWRWRSVRRELPVDSWQNCCKTEQCS